MFSSAQLSETAHGKISQMTKLLRKRNSLFTTCRGIALMGVLLTAGLMVGEGTQITPPKNSYKPADDLKVGQEAAGQVRREMPILPEDGDVDSYVERVGQGLVAKIPPEFGHSEFKYEFSVVNASDINAFTLPGGPMFVNRGMIEAAHSEGEMAGVMAHELSHVALRHGTAQASKSGSPALQIGAIGGAILGAIIGGDVGDVVAQGTQIGLGTYMLKFSREYETQADVLGAQIMARAGYDPRELANMFKTIEGQGGSGGPQWMSDHPNPGNRYERISEEAGKVSIDSNHRAGEKEEFARAQAALKGMAPAPTMDSISKSTKPGTGNGAPGGAPPDGKVEGPSDQYRTFDGGRFRLAVPGNWKEFKDSTSVTFAPTGAYGVVQGQSVFTHGAIAGVANVSSTDLAKATNEYVSGVLQGNAYLQATGKSQRSSLGGKDALKSLLSGTSPVTKRKENVDVYTSMIGNGQLFYLVQVVPANEQGAYKKAFAQILKSVTISK